MFLKTCFAITLLKRVVKRLLGFLWDKSEWISFFPKCFRVSEFFTSRTLLVSKYSPEFKAFFMFFWMLEVNISIQQKSWFPLQNMFFSLKKMEKNLGQQEFRGVVVAWKLQKIIRFKVVALKRCFFKKEYYRLQQSKQIRLQTNKTCSKTNLMLLKKASAKKMSSLSKENFPRFDPRIIN